MIDCCVKRRWPDLNHLSGRKLAKTWRTPLQKASDPGGEYEWLHEIADKASPAVAAAFERAVAKVRGTVKEVELQSALERGDVEAAMRVLDIDGEMTAALKPEVIPPLEDVFIAAGRDAPVRTIGAQVAMRFDLTNPNVARFLQTYDFGLIRQVSQETRDAIRRVVTDAVTNGGAPKVQARAIRDHIGLTDRQAQAALNYRDALSIEGRPADQVMRMTEKYRARLLRQRALNIASTETINASAAGTQAAWDQAADSGLLNRATVRQGWGVTGDDRLCVVCAAIPLMNPDGVSLGGYFASPVGPIKRPTAHPGCRCYLYLRAF